MELTESTEVVSRELTKQYPIAEIFHSVQGEAYWAGTPMFFIRLAGCNVGKYTQVESRLDVGTNPLNELRMLNPTHSICTTFDGQQFMCDTDYRAVTKLSVEKLMEEINIECHVCITGGEPLLHDLEPLITALSDVVDMVHIETSGTIPLPNYTTAPPDRLWVTCCPKLVDGKKLAMGAADVDEWKILVGPDFKTSTLEWIDDYILSVCEYRYLQPINGIMDVNHDNMKKCLQLLERFPRWRLSAQLHKLICGGIA
jgi:7-carboxy-7-deazaguanine synthase